MVGVDNSQARVVSYRTIVYSRRQSIIPVFPLFSLGYHIVSLSYCCRHYSSLHPHPRCSCFPFPSASAMSNLPLGGVVVEGEEDEESEEEESSEEEEEQVRVQQPQGNVTTDTPTVDSAAEGASPQHTHSADIPTTQGKQGDNKSNNRASEQIGSTDDITMDKDTTDNAQDGDNQVVSSSLSVPQPSGQPPGKGEADATNTTSTLHTLATTSGNDQATSNSGTKTSTPGASAPVECGRQLPRTAWTVGQRKQRNHTQALRSAYGQRWMGQLQGTQRTFTQVNSATLKTLHSAQEISHHVRVVNDDLRQLTAVLDGMAEKSRGAGRLQFGSVA
eukprot:TRINITY_DN9936_c0_g1_i2.p1 TRINITY_DN9936_c0_g1~~TRINITY_DN9936_c0_g1_i2.p1  ORF type:complete len:332 (-),score=49.44 TRINITY_DN9936_c0_g1_i2:31-1026(-)